MENNKFEQTNNDKPISQEEELFFEDGQHNNISQKEVSKESKASVEELHLLVNKLNTEILGKEPLLQQAEDAIKNTEDKIKQVDGSREKQLYQEFCDQLGNFDQKIAVLKNLQKDLSVIFTTNNDKSKDQSLSNQVEGLAKTISKLEAFKTSPPYGDSQFASETKNLFPTLTAIEDRISSLADGKYNKYVSEKISNSHVQEQIDKDPETLKLKENLKKLQEFKDKFEDELANLKIDRYNAVIEISKIEGTLE